MNPEEEIKAKNLLDRCENDSAELARILRGFSGLEQRVINLENQKYIINDIPKVISENVKAAFDSERSQINAKFNDLDKRFTSIDNQLEKIGLKVQPVVDGKKRIDNVLKSLGIIFIITLMLGLSSSETRKLVLSIFLGS